MGWDCPCGASVGTQAHWCEALQARHAERVERLLAPQASLLIAASSHPGPGGQATAELMRLTEERREDMHE